jgi:hypothetical protein
MVTKIIRNVKDAEAFLHEFDPGTDAYDGSNEPQKRELTARERDVLVRMLTFLLHSEDYADETEKLRLYVIRDVVNPRKP